MRAKFLQIILLGFFIGQVVGQGTPVFAQTLCRNLQLSRNQEITAIKNMTAQNTPTQKLNSENIMVIALDLAKLESQLAELATAHLPSAQRQALVAKFTSEMQSFTQIAGTKAMSLYSEARQQLWQEQKKVSVKNNISKQLKDKLIKKQESELLDGRQLVMHLIRPGRYLRGLFQVETQISKSFALANTPTTQFIWRQVVMLAQNKFPGKYRLDAEPSLYRGDNRPVEQVSYFDVQIWLEALNALSQAQEPALADLIVGHQAGDLYRLPTSAEWEFVLRGRGQYYETFFFGANESELVNYAWYNQNSGGQTMAVGQRRPLIVDGQAFYDMLGNVWEWMQDWHEDQLTGGVDPQGPSSGIYRVQSGASFNALGYQANSGYRNYMKPNESHQDVGFRVLRIIE